MLPIVASLTYNSRGVIYDRNIFIIQATDDSQPDDIQPNDTQPIDTE